MIHASKLGLMAGLSLFAASLQAADDTPLTINITANRTAQSNVDSLASVTVIDRAEIERRRPCAVCRAWA